VARRVDVRVPKATACGRCPGSGCHTSGPGVTSLMWRPAAPGVTSAAASAPQLPAVTVTVPPQVLGGTRGTEERTRWHTERLTGSALQGLGGTRGTQVRTRWHTQPALTPHRREPGVGLAPSATRTTGTTRTPMLTLTTEELHPRHIAVVAGGGHGAAHHREPLIDEAPRGRRAYEAPRRRRAGCR
jgi:hypothetical protein